MKKMRKLLALIMVFALVISMTSISASASDNIACEGKEICEHDYSEGSGEDTLADLYAEDEEVSDDTESTAEDAEADTTSVAEQDESIDETSEAEEIAEGNADDVSLVPDGAASSSDEDNNFPDAISNEEESEVGGNETALINYISEAERLLTDSSEEEGTSSYDANGPCLDSCDVLIEGELCYSLAFEALELINEIRVSAGVSSLVMDPTVLDFAMVRATETALYCAHNRPNGAGYTYGCSMADQENIHYGSGNLGSPEAAVSSWVNSIGHYSNMLAEDYKSTGIGVFKVNGQYFWVQVFSKDDGSEVYATNYSDAFISTTVNIADYRITDKISAYVVDSYLEVGETEQVEVWFEETDLCVCYYELPPNGMNYTSSDESVVTVSASGVATAVGEGTATISATYPGYDLDPWKFDITVCNHDAGYTSVVTTDPTCDEEGLRTYTCEDCGDSYTETIDALGHTWDDGEITEASTCVDQGTCLYTCETCGDTKTGIVVPTYQHIYDNGVVTTEPTCGEYGVMTYTCGTCGTTTTEKISPTYDHTYDDGVVGVPQTCVTTGTMIYTCTGCGTTKTSYLEATNEHVLSEVQVIKEPTCTSYGQSAQQCGTCGQYFNVAFIDPVDHDYDDGVAQSELKCGSVVEMLYTCKSCGNEKTSSEYISHVYDEGYVSTEPTCTAKGKTTYTCELCGKTKTVADIAALGHSEVEDAAEAPTCTETGLTTGSHCERCDVVITAQAEVSATGHSYSSSIVAPTCTTGGYTEHICDVCGNTYQDTATSSLGHTWDEGTVTTAPKCESAGAMTYTCKTCGNTKVEAVEATGHSYGKTVTAPTCEGQGFTTYTCAGCRDSYKSDYVDKLGHKYDGGKTTKNATCTETGIETYTCTACGAFYTQELPALGHEAVSDAASTPTCEDFGLTEGSHCSRCETVLEDQETVEATGHTWNEGVVTKAATTEETGIMTYTCSVCGDTKEESIPCIEEAAFLRGDVDENGTVDIIDCVRIVRYIAGYNVKINLNAADMTGDGSINTFDVVRLMKYIAGYDV